MWGRGELCGGERCVELGEEVCGEGERCVGNGKCVCRRGEMCGEG